MYLLINNTFFSIFQGVIEDCQAQRLFKKCLKFEGFKKKEILYIKDCSKKFQGKKFNRCLVNITIHIFSRYSDKYFLFFRAKPENYPKRRNSNLGNNITHRDTNLLLCL